MSAKPHFACQKPGLARHLCKRLLSESAVAKKHSFAWPTQTAFSDSPVICDQGVLEHGMGQCFTLVEQKVAKVTFPKAAEAFSHRCTRVQTFAGQSVCMFAAPWLRRGHSDCRHCGEACCRAERKGRSLALVLAEVSLWLNGRREKGSWGTRSAAPQPALSPTQTLVILKSPCHGPSLMAAAEANSFVQHVPAPAAPPAPPAP